MARRRVIDVGRLDVLTAGLETTVQDLGRWGWQRYGVSPAGPMDESSHRRANALVGNDPRLATLEIALVGPTIRFVHRAICAVAGARFHLTVDGRPVAGDTTFPVSAGEVLRFGERVRGARAYLAVQGGVEVPLVLGSRATHVPSGLGGLGRALRAGDVLFTGEACPSRVPASEGRERPLPDGGAEVRAIPGPDVNRFGASAIAVFGRETFRLASESNRMGYRLIGPDVAASEAGEIVSDATPAGTVQVPPSGQPILLMVDRPTCGGYPRLATVISADLPLAGQLAPGDWIAFRWCGLEEARAARTAAREAWLSAPGAGS